MENSFDDVHCIPNWLGCLRVGGVGDAFDDLQRVTNSIIHLSDSFETPEHFHLLIACRGARAYDKCERQRACQKASSEAKRCVAM